MFVKHLSLSQFRNYETAEIGFEPGINLLLGPNGHGKTNIVEAIRYLGSLYSHRVAGYQALIRRDAAGQQQNQALIRALASFNDRDVLLELELNASTQNRARINKSDVPRVRDLLGYVNSVIFAPEDLDIVRRDPSNRRAFLDELVVQAAPRFAGVYSDYERVLKQRNTLLKSARATKTTGAALSTLDAWDESLVRYGAEIIVARIELVEKLRPHLTKAYQSIAEANNVPGLEIKSSVLVSGLAGLLDDDELTDEGHTAVVTSDRAEIERLFHVKLQEVRPKELERGLTLIGPQRDDLVLSLGNLPVKGYASHGESISFALALRLASAELLRAETRSGDPVLILDDVFAELDEGRRNRLAQLIAPNEQVFITAADTADLPMQLQMIRFDVNRGVVSRSE